MGAMVLCAFRMTVRCCWASPYCQAYIAQLWSSLSKTRGVAFLWRCSVCLSAVTNPYLTPTLSPSSKQTYPNLHPPLRVGPPLGCLPREGANLCRFVPVRSLQTRAWGREFVHVCFGLLVPLVQVGVNLDGLGALWRACSSPHQSILRPGQLSTGFAQWWTGLGRECLAPEELTYQQENRLRSIGRALQSALYRLPEDRGSWS